MIVHPTISMTANLLDNLHSTTTAALTGSVVEIIGMTVAVADFPAPVGAVVSIERETSPAAEGEVVGFRDDATIIYLIAATTGVRRGNRVRSCAQVGRCAWGLSYWAELLMRAANASTVGRSRLCPIVFGKTASRHGRSSGRGFASRWPRGSTPSTHC